MAYNFVRASSQDMRTSTAPVGQFPMTLSAWVYPVTSGLGLHFVQLAQGLGAAAHRVRLTTAVPSDTVWRVAVRATVGGANTNNTADGSVAIALNQWTHVAAACNSAGSGFSLYVGGSLISTNTNAITAINTLTQCNIGVDNNGGGFVNHHDGNLAEIGIWSVALAAGEIASLAKGMACRRVRPQSLAFYAPLIRNVADGKGLAITQTNSPTVAVHPRVYA